jgi:hypothetical protein
MSDDDDGDFGVFVHYPEVFLFGTALYDPISISSYELESLFEDELKLDGYCPRCHEKRTFRKSKAASIWE